MSAPPNPSSLATRPASLSATDRVTSQGTSNSLDTSNAHPVLAVAATDQRPVSVLSYTSDLTASSWQDIHTPEPLTPASVIQPVIPSPISTAPLPLPVSPVHAPVPASTPQDTLKVSPLGARLIQSLSQPIASVIPTAGSTIGKPVVVSATAPQNDIDHSNVFLAAVRGNAVQASGGAAISNAHVLQDPSALLSKIAPKVISAISNVTGVTGTPLGPDPKDVVAKASESQDPTLTPPGFVLSGEVNLFNVLSVELYSFHGTATDGKREIVVLNHGGDLSIGKLFKFLQGSLLDDVVLKDAQLSYNEKPLTTRRSGLWFDTLVTFEGKLQPIADALKDIFKQETPELKLSALLANYADWTTPLRTSGFTMQAIIPGMTAKLGDYIEFTSVGVNIDVVQRRDPLPPNTLSYTCEFGLFGTLKLEIPGSITPLVADFSLDIQETSYALRFSLGEDRWDTAFGIAGFHLVGVQFSADIPKGHEGSVALNIQAALDIDSTAITIEGHYSSKTDWELKGSVTNFAFQDLLDLYDELFNIELHPLDHDISFGDLEITVNQDGFKFSGETNIENHNCASATITLGNHGIEFEGRIGDVTLEHVEILEAQLDVKIHRKDTAKPGKAGSGLKARFAMFGNVDVDIPGADPFSIAVGAYFEKPEDKLLYTVYAEIAAKDPSKPVSISHLLPAVKGSFLDIALEDVAFIVSNVKSGVSHVPNKFKYQIDEGFKFAAVLDSPSQLNKAMNANSSRLTFEAEYDTANKAFKLLLTFATQRTVSLGKGVKSSEGNNLTIGIEANPDPQIVIKDKMDIIVGSRPDPLHLSLTLCADALQANATGEIEDWTDPLGISEQLKVEDFAIQIGIIYAGGVYPSTLGLRGALEVGSVEGKVAFLMSEDPADELLSVGVNNFSLGDLVILAEKVLGGSNLTKPPEIIEFKEFLMYISSGATIGGTTYPPGFEFDCDVLIFGAEATVHCGVDKKNKMVQFDGTITPFKLGPLEVKGFKQDKPELQLQIGTGTQHFLVDGAVTFLGKLEADLHAVVELNPMHVQFLLHLAFTEHLTFDLEAEIATPPGALANLKNHSLEGYDFNLTCQFRQDILDHMIEQANVWFLAAKKNADQAFGSLNDHLDKAKKDFNEAVDNAQKDLDAKDAAWKKKQEQVNSDFELAKKNAEAQGQRLQKNVDDTKAKFDAFIDKLEKELEAAKEKEALEIQKAEKAIQDAKISTDNTINDKVKQVYEAEANMTKKFGNAEHALEDARAKVQQAENEVNRSNGDVQTAKNALNDAHWYNKVPKALELAEKEAVHTAKVAACEVAKGILTAADDVIKGPAYALAKHLMDDAAAALNEARVIADKTLDDVTKGLETVKAAQAILVNTAEKALEGAKNACEELKVWNLAKAALEDFTKAQVSIISTAQKAVKALESCTEFIAYNAATAALKLAKASTKEIDIAEHAVDAVKDSADFVLNAAKWMVNEVGNIFDVKDVFLSGSLKGLHENPPKPLIAKVHFIFAKTEHTQEVEFVPGDAEAFLKKLFESVLADVKKGVLSIV